MNHCVPDFDIEMDDDEYPIPSSSGLACAKKSSMQGDEIMELLWQNGQVVMQSQNHRSPRKPTPASYTADAVIPAGPSTTREVRPSQQPEVESYQTQHLFMQEDEMTSWLHYPIVDDSPLDHNFCADLLYLPPTANNNINNNNNTNSSVQNPARTAQKAEFRQPTRTVVAPRPPIAPARRTEPVQTKIQNFAHFSKRNARVEPGPSSSKNVIKESTVVDSSDTPAVAAVSRISETVRNSAEPADIEAGKGSISTAGVAAPSTTSAAAGTGGREMMTCEMTVTSSPGGSSASAEPAHRAPAPAEDRKRKGREPEDSECQSEDVDLESADVRKQARGSTSNKRSRAAEVHNLSERKRRDRINEKMRALQELIPRCNKSDKASMLDEAIEYLKSLQLQVQMMSMGCGMVPMMFPGIQQYMAAAPMGMGIGMGMGMGMEMGMNRPVMPFPNMLGGSALPAATAAAAYLGPRFPVPPFHMPPNVPHAPDSSRMQPANQADPPMLNSPGASDPNQLPIPNIGDPYQQYLGPHQMQFQVMQNQATNQPNFSKPSSSKDNEKPDNHKSEGT